MHCKASASMRLHKPTITLKLCVGGHIPSQILPCLETVLIKILIFFPHELQVGFVDIEINTPLFHRKKEFTSPQPTQSGKDMLQIYLCVWGWWNQCCLQLQYLATKVTGGCRNSNCCHSRVVTTSTGSIHCEHQDDPIGFPQHH